MARDQKPKSRDHYILSDLVAALLGFNVLIFI